MKSVVLDASALIAAMYLEKGADLVKKHIDNALISTVNLTEVIENMLSRGVLVSDARKIIDELSIKTIDYTEEHTFIAAGLRKPNKHKGLSLGDRACLALAMAEKLTVLTADKAWKDIDIDIKIQLIR